MSSALPWYMLLLPFFAAVVILLFTKSYRDLSSFISVAAALASFVCSCVVFLTPNIRAFELTWIDLRPILYGTAKQRTAGVKTSVLSSSDI